jgi:hypothetical protein
VCCRPSDPRRRTGHQADLLDHDGFTARRPTVPTI